MASLGELFIELGVIGDTKELDKLNKKLTENVKAAEDVVKAVQEEIIYNNNLMEITEKITKAKEEYNNATTEEAKATAKAVIQAHEAQKARLQELKSKKDALKAAKEQQQANKKNIDANNELKNNISGIVTGFLAFVGAIAGAAAALNKLTKDLVASNQEFLNLTRTSDIALNTFQKWNGIGKMLGVKNAAQQLEGLNERLFELRLTGQGARGFQLAGINPMGQDAEGVLEQIRARIQGMDDTSAAYLLKQMGLDPQMLHLLRLGREEFEALNNEMREYRLTPEQTASIQQMNIQLKIASQKLQYLKDRAILKIMPYFVELVKSFTRVTEMLIKWGKAIKNANLWWRGLITWLVYGLIRIEKVRLFFKGLSKALSEVITHIPKLGRAFAWLGRIFARALLPLTALYLLLDDLAGYFEGKDSLIGRVLNWGQEKGAEIGDAFKKMFGGDFLGGMGDLANTTFDILNDLLKVIINLLEKILNILTFGFSDKLKNSPLGKFLFPKVDEVYEQVTSKNLPKNKLSKAEHRQLVSPSTEQTINNNKISNNTSSPQFTQTNYIQTQQPAQDIQRELEVACRFANTRFA